MQPFQPYPYPFIFYPVFVTPQLPYTRYHNLWRQQQLEQMAQREVFSLRTATPFPVPEAPKAQHYKTWSEDEENVLKKMALAGNSYRKIAQVVHRTAGAVHYKAHSLGLTPFFHKKPVWTQEEIFAIQGVNEDDQSLLEFAEKHLKTLPECKKMRHIFTVADLSSKDYPIGNRDEDNAIQQNLVHDAQPDEVDSDGEKTSSAHAETAGSD